MNSSACSAVICQPGGHEQKHNNNFKGRTGEQGTAHHPSCSKNALVQYSKIGCAKACNTDELPLQTEWQDLVYCV